jgi:hypothetical protein
MIQDAPRMAFTPTGEVNIQLWKSSSAAPPTL